MKKGKKRGNGVLIGFFVIAGLLLFRPQIKQLGFIGKSFNMNELKILAEDGLDKSKLKITVQVEGADQPLTVYEGQPTSDIPEMGGKSQWEIVYDNRLKSSFSHDKSEEWHDYQYNFRVYEDSTGTRFHAILFGQERFAVDQLMEPATNH